LRQGKIEKKPSPNKRETLGGSVKKTQGQTNDPAMVSGGGRLQGSNEKVMGKRKHTGTTNGGKKGGFGELRAPFEGEGTGRAGRWPEVRRKAYNEKVKLGKREVQVLGNHRLPINRTS